MIDKMKEKYLGAVGFFSAKLPVTVAVTAGVIVLLVGGFKLTPTSFLPEEDQGIILPICSCPTPPASTRPAKCWRKWRTRR